MQSIGWQVYLAAKYFTRGTILEVGVGARLPAQLLREEGWQVTGMDIEPQLKPDIVGSVDRIPVADASFDCFVCCQVLEHVPWSNAQTALRELHRICRRGGIISVPTCARAMVISYFGPKRRKTVLLHGLNLVQAKPRTPKEHHWELEAGVRTSAFRRAVAAAGFRIIREVRPSALLYHHFMVVEKKT